MEERADIMESPESSPPCTPRKRKSLEMETLDEPDEDSARHPDATPAPQLRHFKATYDQLWDYPAICKNFFLSDMPYLAVREHPTTNAHVHFQGYSRIGDDSLKKKITRLAKTHHLKKENKHQRPVCMAKREVTDVGFQYMCKDLTRPPLAVNMFTPDDLAEMKAKSTMRIKDIKYKLQDYIAEIAPEEALKYMKKGDQAEDLLNAVARLLMDHEKAGKLVLPPISRHTRDSIKNGLMRMPRLSSQYKALIYVSK